MCALVHMCVSVMCFLCLPFVCLRVCVCVCVCVQVHVLTRVILAVIAITFFLGTMVHVESVVKCIFLFLLLYYTHFKMLIISVIFESPN